MTGEKNKKTFGRDMLDLAGVISSKLIPAITRIQLMLLFRVAQLMNIFGMTSRMCDDPT
jgi:hypothetical protein